MVSRKLSVLPVLLLSGLACLLICNLGCAPDTEPIERGANAMIDGVVKPAVAKAADELSARTAQYQGQGSLINPGYRIQGHGVFGTGVVYNFEVNAVGVSANVSGATQQDAGQEGSVPPPALREEPVAPE